MTARDRALLKRLAHRLRTDDAFRRAVAAAPDSALARYALSAAQRAAVASLAVALAVAALPDTTVMVWG